jgi:hypothetical protein
MILRLANKILFASETYASYLNIRLIFSKPVKGKLPFLNVHLELYDLRLTMKFTYHEYVHLDNFLLCYLN